ncbi:AraC family transcriptional regulator [Sphingobacterium sp. DN00404]|uniref:AraC family transcriptional regulator n=1 Tax=Sphingobacterium micropteri TaxID=2763501 RepID=A0ABR7YTE1_9SPHI|nr:helix-turn-helix domain-containing protein [Sphingobacterium micropteri]MBD1434603.1 AraC family transcriptional regulator [Sphingobacterium micropteri]
MVKKIFNIPDFVKYVQFSHLKNEHLHIVNFANEKDFLRKSQKINIDFYLLAIKPPMEKNQIVDQKFEDQANSFLYVDCPQNTMAWDVNEPDSGYVILVDAKLIQRVAKAYNFVHYNNHEALYLTKDEEVLLWDLFKKTYDEFQKSTYAKDVIVSYITLILSYTQIYYNRQFDTRSEAYHEVVENFYKNLNEYYHKDEGVSGMPSVAYFAQKANLSPNYFGDLVKHFTGESPIEHIQEYVLKLAKDKLKNTSLSISQISYSLGFDYPNYFARFFRKKTGMSPKIFKNI